MNNHLSVVDNLPPATGSGGQTHWASGWTVGARLGIRQSPATGRSASNTSFAAFERQTYQLAGTAAGTYTFDAKPRDIQWAVVRMNYKFDAPVIARY